MTDDIKISKDEADLLYLIASVLNGKTPDNEYIRSVNIEHVAQLAKFHSVASLVASAFGKASTDIESHGAADASALHFLYEEKEKSIRKKVLFDNERKKILNEFAEHGIWFMPLKGIIMQDYYPGVGLRQMSDNDILFDCSKRKEVRNIMISRGYKVEVYGKGNHDVYINDPFYRFEMHIGLFGQNVVDGWVQYYDGIMRNLVCVSECEKRFTNEDAYIYMLAHAYKHFINGGTGVRSLVDIYVYNRKFVGLLNREYIKKECRKLGIAEYENSNRILVNTIFGKQLRSDQINSAIDENLIKLLKFHIHSGTYGTLKHRVEKMIFDTQDMNKIKYLIYRVFPGNKWFKDNYRMCEKYPILIPLYVIRRIVYRPIVNRKSIIKEIRTVKNVRRYEK